MEKLKVNNIIISKQGKESKNFETLINIVKKKKVNVVVVQSGDKVQIDKSCYFDILFPTKNLISNNVLNNNSIVAKFCMQNSSKQVVFSMLFTGDIEKIAEENLLQLYAGTNNLEASILKVAHHGSKTSSTQKFLEKVKPKIALIGVGKNNTFGHPSDSIIKRLESLRDKSL
ncbi:MAG: hypothetical protein J6D03_09560 [Clostridia bacterium]|nr:hypothetical protein [Clostridia bacterium]